MMRRNRDGDHLVSQIQENIPVFWCPWRQTVPLQGHSWCLQHSLRSPQATLELPEKPKIKNKNNKTK